MIVIWQAAIPPALCAVALLVKYIVFTELYPVRDLFSSGSNSRNGCSLPRLTVPLRRRGSAKCGIP